MDKRRSSNRLRTLLEARIVFNNRFSLIECTVRNLSQTGARIAFPHPIEIPPEFELEIPRREMSLRAKVVWSDGKEHGIRFIEGRQDTAPEDGRIQRKQTASDAERHSVEEILNEARHRIAQVMGVSPDAVELRLEITG